MNIRTGFFDTSNIYERNIKSLLNSDLVIRFLSSMSETVLTPTTRINRNIVIKEEQQTPSGTFKFRGASLLLSMLQHSSNAMGLVASSTGNHGFSLAMICKDLGLRLTVFVPIGTLEEKITRIRSLGSDVITAGGDLTETISIAKDFSIENNKYFISSTDELLAIGHSTLITEFSRQVAGTNKLYFPIGVGSGVAGQIVGKILNDLPIEIIGVVHESHSAWAESLTRGAPEYVKVNESLAPGLKITKPNPEVFHFVRRYLSDFVVIGDKDLLKTAELLAIQPLQDLTSLVSLSAALKARERCLAVRC